MTLSKKHSEKIKAAALQCGFDAASITKAEIPENHAIYFTRWLEEGMHADMTYMDKRCEMRLHPQKLFPGVKSVIVLLKSYYRHDLPDKPDHKIARYATGKDYHKRLKKKMQKLQKSVREITNMDFTSRPFVDSAPVLERSLAVKAGLGWIGKNTCLIHPGLGSYVFIAELFTDLELPGDTDTVKNHCGNCTRCIDACPTHALSEKGLDAGRCISYHTIESKGDIPGGIKNALNGWVFGCDICQEVCPHNHKTLKRTNTDPDFMPGEHLAFVNLDYLSKIDDEQFKKTFAGTPLMRAGRTKLLKTLKAPKTGGNQ